MRRLTIALALMLAGPATAGEAVSFARNVLPILSEHCLSCHGQDESHRKAKLRLDLRDNALAPREGGAAIVPGKPQLSSLIARIRTSDPDDVMPPPKNHKPLSPTQMATLERWIAEGAPWGRHWAFDKPVRPTIPAISGASHPIDAFVRERLAHEKLSPSPEAPRHTLLRRLSFDLTGLPPTPEEVDAFVADRSPDAYEKQVDRLLASPHLGERLAMWWLDAARYSDTDGFQADDTRTNWPWRDWVVEAFNRNLPFDRFTIEQCAGDLLPDATPETRLATCFHRNHMTNGEGGRDPEESRIDYVIDRVNTTGTTWLGLTVGCAQCHTHKFDPVSHADYYSLAAFFDSIDEDGKAGKAAKPYLTYASPHTARAIAEAKHLVDERAPREDQARREAQVPFSVWLAERAAEVHPGFSAWAALRASALETANGTVLTQDADGVIQAGGPNPNQDDYRVVARGPFGKSTSRITGLRLEIFAHPAHTKGSWSRGASGAFILTDVKVQVRREGSAQVREIALSRAIADAADDPKKHNGYGAVKDVLDDDPRNGWSTRDSEPTATRTAVLTLAEPLILAADESLVVELRQRSTLGDANLGRFRLATTAQRGPVLTAIGPAPLEQLPAAADPLNPDGKLRGLLFDQFLADHAPYQAVKSALDRARDQLKEADAAQKVEVMVLAEREKPRDTRILLRGVWDKKGEQVKPGIPTALTPWVADAPRNRLGLARWLVSPDNPLTARVLVNHCWQLLFGAGLVRTPDDFGLQGERPTHPDLLDWLAVETVANGWDVKRLLRLIVTSATYRQRSTADAALIARDPDNRLLARGARFRLPSWMLRDAALTAAGLLNPALGGPPARPYQPDGVWEELFMGRFHYVPSDGPAQYRRSLYAFWRRAAAPTFLFDTAQRRSCEVKPPRTNTPLQALTMLNDTSWLESARVLAGRALAAARDDRGRLRDLARRILSRDLGDGEARILLRQSSEARARYRAEPLAATTLLAIGQSPEDPALERADHAALMLTASLLLNLDEAMTHE